MDIKHNKEKLESEKKLLEEEMKSIGQVDKSTNEWQAMPEAQTAPEADENDQADRAENYEERTGTMSVLDKRLDQIKEALKSIEEGSYGICKNCGQHIEEDRLKVNPAALTCKNCMEKVI